jgi:DNA polymerase-4
MDAFYASVEQRDKPEYRNKPIVVGGTPAQRGVVAAASYEARRFGIHSAMPSRTALQRCPHVIFVRPRFDAYKAVSEQIQEIFHRYTDLVEPLALDEAFLDVTTNKRGLPSATLIAREIKECILNETNLTASAGVSVNKFLAKTASQVNKPNGLFLIPPDQAETYVEKLAIDKFFGIGKVTAEKMRNAGVNTGADLKQWSEVDLIKRFGKAGSFYYRIVRGQDDRPVEPNRIRKSIGAEESFAEDLADRAAIDQALREIAETVLLRLEKSETSGRTLTVKVKYSNYQQVTRSRTLPESIKGLPDMLEVAQALLATTEIAERNIRLLGLSISNLDCENEEEADCVQLTLDFR